jgi:hypothetical protein
MGGQGIAPGKDDVLVRPYERGDEHGIAALFEVCFGTPLAAEHWEWKYGKNPYGNRCIMVAVSGGSIIGQYAGYPVYMEDGRCGKVRALHVGDIMTSTRARRLGVGRRSVVARLTHAFIDEFSAGKVAFDYGSPTERHFRLGKRFMRYYTAGPILLWTREGKPEPQSPWRRVADKLARKRCTIGESRSIEADVAGLYQEIKGDLGISLCREEAYLEWRYMKCPGKRYLFCRLTRRERLALWAVLLREGSDVLLGEVLVRPGDSHLLRELAVELSRRWPGSCLKLWAPTSIPWWTDMLTRAGFTCAPHPLGLQTTFSPFDPENYPVDRLQREWFYAMGDFDLF